VSNACSWRALAVTAMVFASLVLVVNPSAGFSLDAGNGTPTAFGAQSHTAPRAEFVEKLVPLRTGPALTVSVPDPARATVLPRTGAEVPILIGAAAFFLIIGYLLFWTGGFGGDK
jgi:hypothetical protein